MSFISRYGESVAASSILASGDSLLTVKGDVMPVMNRALDSLITKDHKRGESTVLLAMYANHDAYSRFGSNVDKLPALVESSNASASQRVAMVDVVVSALSEYNSEVATQLPKVITKLVGVVVRLCVSADEGTSMYGLNLLKALAEHKARPIMLPFAKQARQACVQLINERSTLSEEHGDLIAEVFAAYASLESAEAWSGIWGDIVRESAALLSTLGIGHSSNSKKVGKNKNAVQGSTATDAELTSLMLLADSGVTQLRGAEKALRVQLLFRCITALLTQLLRTGCSSGFVALNLTQLLTVHQLLLSSSADVAVRDPVVYIENEMGVAPVDVALVLSLMKVDLLSTITMLLSIDHPALIRVGTSLVRPVAALLTRPEGKQVPRLTLSLQRCLGAAARVLPGVVAASLNATATGLLELLQREVQVLTTNPASLSAAPGSGDDKNGNKHDHASADGNLTFSTAPGSGGSNVGVKSTVPANLTGSVITNTVGSMEFSGRVVEAESRRITRLTVLFETCEAVLLHSGPLLSASVREAFTAAVHDGLNCLSLGVQMPQFADRHMHRHTGAPLRQDPVAQRLLLELAIVEVFCPPQLQHQAQQFSRNLPLLKRCAELCLRRTETAAVAGRALLHFSTLLHPVTVALPAVPAVHTARSYILTASDALPTATPLTVGSEAANGNAQDGGLRSPGLQGVAELFGTAGSGDAVEQPLASPAASAAVNVTAAAGSAGKHARDGAMAEATPSKRTKAGHETLGSAAKDAAHSAPAPTLLPSASAAEKAAVRAEAQLAEEDEESLPDIDIEADPDSE